MNVYVNVYGYVYVSLGARRGQKRALNLPELEFTGI